MYAIGTASRLQIFVIAYFLFKVETENMCIVEGLERQPIPLNLLPEDLSNLPGDFANISYIV